jgi:hypothetical protein
VRQPLRHNLTAAQAVKAMRRRLGKADEHHAAVADAIRFALRKILGTIGIAQYEARVFGQISIGTLSGIAKKSLWQWAR